MADFIIVENFPDSTSAHIAKGLLEAHEIKCFLENDGLIDRNPELSVAYGGVNLKVKAEDAERAKKLLEESHEAS